MKIWKLFILLVLALVSCNHEVDMQQEPESSLADIEGQPVTITFSIEGSPTDTPRTKAGDGNGLDSDKDGGLESLHLAVFGGSGYLKEYVEAEKLGEPTSKTDTVVKKVQKYEGGNPVFDADGDPVLEEKEFVRVVPVYKFKAALTMSTSPRSIHFLGNGPATLPFGWDSDVIPVQLSQLRKYIEEGTEEEQQLKSKAYWQMVQFPQGITAKKMDGYYYSKHGYRYGVQEEEEAFYSDGGFQITDEVSALFQNIPLIRNWAKVAVYSLPEEDSNFEAVSFAIINVPSRGALAPYNSTTGKFVQDYETKRFDDLRDEGYPASLPENTVFDTEIPAAEEFEKYLDAADPKALFTDGDRVAPASSLLDLYSPVIEDVPSVYLYERPAPSEYTPPSYVIVYGKYYEGEAPNRTYTPCYYKVDLMETVTDDNDDKVSRYYPIYRNFKYQIHISKILSRGHNTPAAAAASAGSADVSADVTTGHISDISDGESRLHLNWMAKTYTEGTEETTLSVYFSDPDGEAIMSQYGVPDDPANPEVLPTKYVIVELRAPSDNKKKSDGTYDHVIEPGSLKLDPPSQNTTDGTYGWRRVRFRVKEYTGRVARSQSIRITGVHADGKIYRDVVVSVLPKQPLWVKCGESRILPQKGIAQTVTFGIPDGLIKSMFPLEFTIEADRMTLTTDTSSGDNMPVLYGESISLDNAYAGKTAFHFLRTITWDEYKSLETKDQDERIWRVVTCHFITNCEDNAAKVWVQNKYFIHDEYSCDSFENYNFKHFYNLQFPGPIPRKDNQEISFYFYLDENGKDAQGRSKYPKITLTARGVMPPNEGSPLEPEGEAGTYSFVPEASPVYLTFYTANDEGEVSIDLSADDYYPAHLEPYRFNKNAPAYSYGLLEGIKVGDNYSNVAFQRVESGLQYGNGLKDRGVIFGYYDDPDAPDKAKVRLVDKNGALIGSNKQSNVSGLYAVTPSSFDVVDGFWYPTEEKTDKRYHEIVLKTPTASGASWDPIIFRLESPGYVTEEYWYPRMNKTRLHTHAIALTNENNRKWIHAGLPDGNGNYVQEDESNPVWTLVPGTKTDESYFNMIIKPLEDNGVLAPAPILNNSGGVYLGGATGTGACQGGRYEIIFRSGNVYVPFAKDNNYKAQHFYYCQFTIPPANKPEAVTPSQGTYYTYGGSNQIYQWIAFDDKSEYAYDDDGNYIGKAGGTAGWTDFSPKVYERSIIFTVGTSHPVRISNISYKALSEVP